MRFDEIHPTFCLVIGGAGSGKNHFIQHHPVYSKFKLIDVDEVKKTMPVGDAISAIKPMLLAAFARKENVSHPGTAANLKAAQNKIAAAKAAGYQVVLVLKDTPTEVALAQVAKRAGEGGHDVDREKIIKSNQVARDNFAALKPLVDQSLVVQ